MEDAAADSILGTVGGVGGRIVLADRKNDVSASGEINEEAHESRTAVGGYWAVCAGM